MKVIIIEDEKPAAEKLRKALQKINPGIEILAILNNVRDSITWFKQNKETELLIFMDIELTDGSSFKILEETGTQYPVIFTTAYDEYWQEAFEHNSIDYILKPIRQDKLEAALMKYDKLKQFFSQNIQELIKYRENGNRFKRRFLVKRGSDYISIRSEDIAYFYATHKMVCLVGVKNQKYILDQSLADLEKQIDPGLFFRINRKYLVNMHAIKRIKTFPKSKLSLELDPPIVEEIIISQENVASFKQWMDQ